MAPHGEESAIEGLTALSALLIGQGCDDKSRQALKLETPLRQMAAELSAHGNEVSAAVIEKVRTAAIEPLLNKSKRP